MQFECASRLKAAKDSAIVAVAAVPSPDVIPVVGNLQNYLNIAPAVPVVPAPNVAEFEPESFFG